MPKVKWSKGLGADEVITAADLDEAESGGSYEPYDGPRPPKGVYGFRIKGIKQAESSGGFPQMIVRLELDPRGRAEHKRFAGYFMQDFIIVKKNTAWKVRPLLDALGVTYREFINNTVVDDDGMITKIGKVTPAGALVIGNIRPSKNNADYDDIAYLPPKDEDAGDSDDDADDDGADDTGEDGGDPF